MGLTITPAITLQADRLRFPGMLPREILIFKQWLKTNEELYDSFDYNIRIGPAFDPGPAYNDSVRQEAIANSKKRIDAVAWKGMQPTIIEVKDRAGLSPIGQILGYKAFWLAEHSDLPHPHLVIVTNRAQEGIQIATTFHDIALHVVPTDFSLLRISRRASPFMAKQQKGVTYL
jgi:hypothetical protein